MSLAEEDDPKHAPRHRNTRAKSTRGKERPGPDVEIVDGQDVRSLRINKYRFKRLLLRVLAMLVITVHCFRRKPHRKRPELV